MFALFIKLLKVIYSKFISAVNIIYLLYIVINILNLIFLIKEFKKWKSVAKKSKQFMHERNVSALKNKILWNQISIMRNCMVIFSIPFHFKKLIF